ncbi:hypothetical protein ONE63_009922 [Megalurothrips usitatus]|uniref:Reverse transcriptase domain-containing protein n=1 Tax=Megalurothrips usitatus TaxID=439358 RepID=A0AAV7XJY7_9NEOP|nr:hypothetical protein ONE63_009922 [Megalurothrips usitatus]
MTPGTHLARLGQPGPIRLTAALIKSTDLRQVLPRTPETDDENPNHSHSYALFIDFKKAYDCIHRPSLYAALAEAGVPATLIAWIRTALEGAQCAVRYRGALSAFFAVVSGLKQGDPLAPILFNLCLECIVGDLHEDQRNPAELRKPLILAFADDIAIVAASKEELVRVATVIKQRAARFGLLISPKTEYMERRQAARERRAAREQQQEDRQQDQDAPDPTDGVP